uniref:Uncharacterized protein n=1 Tax=Romanomermis culicivorax TaxID=13658 RepID=A0A915KJ17_ROMCU
MPEQISTELKFIKEMMMAVELLIKDVVQETEVVKTENLSEMDVIQLEGNTQYVSENDTVTETPMKQTTTSMTPLLKSLSYKHPIHQLG